MATSKPITVGLGHAIAAMITLTGVVLWSAKVDGKADLALHENRQAKTEITEIKTEIKEQGKTLSRLEGDLKSILQILRLRGSSPTQ